MNDRRCALLFSDLSKQLGKNKESFSLKSVRFKVMPKEVFGFLGPNGAGKSTTIKLLLGFLNADSGTIKVMDRLVGKDEYRDLIGYLSELPFFYPHLTGMETLLVSGRLSGMALGDIKKRGMELLERLNLGHAAHQKIKGYSKGMQQRLGIVNALIHDPPILIFDEPMSGLDPMGRYKIKKLIEELRDEGKTVFFSSHILSDIEELCDRIAVIKKGKLLYCGDLDGFGMEKGQNLESRFIEVIGEVDNAVPA